MFCAIFQDMTIELASSLPTTKTTVENAPHLAGDLFDAHDFDIKLDLQVPSAGQSRLGDVDGT